jgi:hemerythrin-like metal-binding protein
MQEVQWTDDLSVGVELIDEQHKMLINRLNSLTRALESQQGPTEIAATLNFLIEYTHFHFSTEEKHMAANSYPGLEQHRRKHGEFKATLGSLEEDFREEGATPMLADSIDTLLVNWLIKHIRGVDVEFGAFLKKNGIVIAE